MLPTPPPPLSQRNLQHLSHVVFFVLHSARLILHASDWVGLQVKAVEDLGKLLQYDTDIIKQFNLSRVQASDCCCAIE